MAHLTLSSSPDVVKKGFTLFPCYAGEALVAGAAVYLKSDGLIYNSGSTSSLCDEANHPMFDGFVIHAVSASAPAEPVTVFGFGSVLRLADSGLTIGTRYWAGSVVGRISDTKLASADTPMVKAVTADSVVVVRGEY